ncbi:hypothetical protein Poli38472_013505 [Pythium oligandrum]|uniref:Molybdenum cofactor sulfurase n=1 Tax=Pythium oligandrum TaxID=41045 RepID=A0A8K1C7W7_PYTOL|nr:hypothetical protein Poli38472_013505 [Pythium oligandrum]|eukprot:TMW58031.1 hypothetical protein Poli38472_013505 [Pythium oligandrum]
MLNARNGFSLRNQTPRAHVEHMEKAAFLREHAGYGYGESTDGERVIDALRRDEFPQLGAFGKLYFDHAGATLYAKSQVEAAFQELQSGMYGNPHSDTSAVLGAEDSMSFNIAAMRRRVLAFCNASEEEYAVVFTSGATAGLKLVGECFPWSRDSVFAHSLDSHTSVLGIRNYASAADARVKSIPIDELRTQAQPTELQQAQLEEASSSAAYHLFAFPAECNFSGTRHSLDLIDRVHRRETAWASDTYGRWLVLLDAAKYAATHQLDLSSFKPDFVVMSFYKLFGYPTGIGALVVKKGVLPLLQKRYYGGGTVANILADRDFVRLKALDDVSRFEDGSISFLSILALRHGFGMIDKLKIESIKDHTTALTRLLRQSLLQMKHWNDNRVCEIYGSSDDDKHQGPIVACNFRRSDGSYVGYSEVHKLAAIHNIQLRTGCFCNPGACQWYLGLQESDLTESMDAGHVCGDDIDIVNGRPTGAVRFSIGYMTTYEDVTALVEFLSKYFVTQAPPSPLKLSHPQLTPSGAVLKKITLFPIKSCTGMSVEAWPVGSRGLLYDREWAIIDASSRKAMTLKDTPSLCFLEPTVDLKNQILRITCRKSQQTTSCPLYSDLREQKSASVETIQLCATQCAGQDAGEHMSQWLSKILGRQCRLVRVPASHPRSAASSSTPSSSPERSDTSNAQIGFANQAQFLLISRASVANLNATLTAADADLQVQEDAFRANLVVDGCEPFAEDSWRSVRAGNVVLGVTGPCSRCSMINIDPSTGAFHRAPLQTLSRYRRERASIIFGQYLTLHAAPPPSSSTTWLHLGHIEVTCSS